jgi:hypothetical protein
MDIDRFEKLLRDSAEKNRHFDGSQEAWEKFNHHNVENGNKFYIPIKYRIASVAAVVISFIGGYVLSNFINHQSESSYVHQNKTPVKQVISKKEEIVNASIFNPSLEKIKQEDSYTIKDHTKKSKKSHNTPSVDISMFAQETFYTEKNKNNSNLPSKINNKNNFKSNSAIQEKIDSMAATLVHKPIIYSLNSIAIVFNNQLDLPKINIDPIQIIAKKTNPSNKKKLYLGGIYSPEEKYADPLWIRLGYTHQVYKNLNLFVSPYYNKSLENINRRSELPKHFPKPLANLKLENVAVDKSSLVIPLGIRYDYNKYRYKPYISLGVAPEFGKITHLTYTYTSTTDYTPIENKEVDINIKTISLYAELGMVGPLYQNISWQASIHGLKSKHDEEYREHHEENVYFNFGLGYQF